MPNETYWKARMEALEDMNHKKGMAYAANVEKQFRMAQKNIEDKINYWYARMAVNNEITMHGAKRLLRADELEEFKWSVEEYIKKGETLRYTDTWAKQLENASAKVHISRLEALKMQMQQECEVLFGNMADGLDDTLRDMYTESYYKTAYEIMKGNGVGWSFNRLDDRRIEKAINTCWTNDGKRFSDRVWTNKSKLVNELNTVLTQNIMRGESPQRAIEQLSKRMKVSRSNAGRLIMTESAFIHSQSQKDCFHELDVERFQFVATLDSHTSEVCQAMDGVIIDMADYKIGLNVPPLHCYCRSCIVPYYEDNEGMRSARGEDGKTYYVPSDMTYKDWKKSFVDGDISGLQEVNMKRDPANFRKSNQTDELINTVEDVNNSGSKMLSEVYESHRISNNLNSTPYDDTLKDIVKADYGNMSVESAKAFNSTIQELSSEYDTPLQKIRTMTKDEALGNRAFAFVTHNYTIDSSELVINPMKCKNAEKLTSRIKELSERGYCARIPDEVADKYVATHEFAHTLLNMQEKLNNSKNWLGADYDKIRKARKEINSVYEEYMKEVQRLTEIQKSTELKLLETMDESTWNEARNALEELKKVKISDYSLENADEFMAEAFTNEKIGVSSNKYGKRIMEIIDKYFKR